ncbi:metalloregulator ArsR/SmtB family transcription factor [Bacillus sp. V2I10]|uniref:ArsR/SmtB family transcription factor n=1 Tax=Bacillus sp. V2I10 TaxID=3042276 RepID=UPI0027D7D626|nr:metalloregulator ArsR/SmtB family transcription factor [Bacillus sp. V2I10]
MKIQDKCETVCVHSVKVERTKKKLEQQEASKVVKIYKALADETRLKIAYALMEEEELCVCDVAAIVGTTSATASHHLRLLKNTGLAKYRKEGKLVYYSLDDDHVKQLIQTAFVHQEEMSVNGS